jgi:hypothetical protein
MKANQKQINEFLSFRHIALVGASRDSKKFGNQVLTQLVSEGYIVYPVHREAEQINGIRCYRSLDELPAEVKSVCLITPKNQTDEMLKKVLHLGIDQVWIQQMSEGPESKRIASEADANIVMGRCIFMYTNPTGVHKFHMKLNKLFGTYAR